MQHKSGFVNIIGKPNVGKSTLMNALLNEKMSIITPKPQTTRHRILGIISDENYQVVLSDTPGLIPDPNYSLHKVMNTYVLSTFEDADIMIVLTEKADDLDRYEFIKAKLNALEVPKFLVINKVDISSPEEITAVQNRWSETHFTNIIAISALLQKGTEQLFNLILQYLPEGPVYYPKDQLSDRPERFFVSEIIREKILELYEQEIPYSTQVEIEAYQEQEEITRIRAIIYVLRRTQKAILIGKAGAAIKKLGILARKDIEKFIDQKVYLELYVKIRENWRDNEQTLKRFGYQS